MLFTLDFRLFTNKPVVTPIEKAKKNAGEKAASFVKEGMVIGLGTGSTAFFVIEELVKRCREGLQIQAVASSEASYAQAKKGGIPLLDINTLTSLDLTLDGADEIDPLKQMIKGGGGALTREKIVASMSQEMVVVIDETKLVKSLGKHKLPVEILPFGHKATLHHLSHLGFEGKIREMEKGKPYITDNGNLIYDIALTKGFIATKAENEKILAIPGVVETGFFFDLAGRVVVGFLDGRVEIL